MQDNVLAHDWSIIPGLINHNPRINPIMQGYVLAQDWSIILGLTTQNPRVNPIMHLAMSLHRIGQLSQD